MKLIPLPGLLISFRRNLFRRLFHRVFDIQTLLINLPVVPVRRKLVFIRDQLADRVLVRQRRSSQRQAGGDELSKSERSENVDHFCQSV